MNIFILFGQTASGKTSKALELCEKHNGEIVNFDSRQIYQKLDIVTGKDVPQESKFNLQIQIQNKSVGYYEFPNPYSLVASHSFRLWLYDIVDPKDTFSSAEYVQVAEPVITDIISRGKTPILVGGTGYYLRHLLHGAPEMQVQEDWKLRSELESKTVVQLQEILKEKNREMFEALNNSDKSNPRRLIRRIEIIQSGITALPAPQTKETLTERLTNLAGVQQDITITYIPFFHDSRLIVQEKITERVEQRMKGGALEEVKKLLSTGYTKDDPGLNAIGYKQLCAYLNKELTLSEAKKQWATKEVQYAKRQKTYFKKLFPHLFKD